MAALGSDSGVCPDCGIRCTGGCAEYSDVEIALDELAKVHSAKIGDELLDVRDLDKVVIRAMTDYGGLMVKSIRDPEFPQLYQITPSDFSNWRVVS
jgi:hypothetical protein